LDTVEALGNFKSVPGASATSLSGSLEKFLKNKLKIDKKN